MAVLTADRFLVDKPGVFIYAPVKDNVKIYKGALVCYDTTGYATIGADTASFVFAGIAEEQADNTIVGHTAGGIFVKLRTGVRVTLPGSGFAQTSVGAAAYVADSGAVSLTATNYVFVGQIVFYNSATSVDVEIPRGGGALLTSISGLTATAAELNQLHSVTPGTTAASKALVVGASKDTDTLKIDAQLTLATAASVAYAATMALVVATPVITVAGVSGTSATNTINCAAVAPAGATLTIVTSADASGTVTTTFGTHFKSTGTQATTASHVSTISFIGDGTNWNEVGRATAM